MAKDTLTLNSPWMKALSLTDEGDEEQQSQDPGGIGADAEARAQAIPQPVQPQHRIDDANTAGIKRGGSPQSSTGPSDSSGFYDPAQWHGQDPARLPLEQSITTDKAALDRMNNPTKATLKQRIMGGIGAGLQGAALGWQGKNDVGATLRDRAEARQVQEKEDLANRIATNTRALSQETMQEQGLTQRAQLAERGMNERARLQQEAETERSRNLATTLSGRAGIANAQIAGRENVAGQQIAGRADIQSDKPVTRVMGDKTYQYDPSSDGWKEVGKAPANVTRPAGGTGGWTQPVVNAAGETVGWINPRMEGEGAFRSVGAVPGASQAATGASGAPLPLKPSGATAGRMQQGQAIQRAGDDLIKDIDTNRAKLGNLTDYWQQMTNGTPISDPTLSGLQAELASFAALQPAAHGARGLQAIQAFEKMIGGIPKNPDALISSIKGIQKTIGALQPPSGQQQQSPPRPSNVPGNYIYNANGPKGKGWYAPAKQ
jgi:hypothetical protein